MHGAEPARGSRLVSLAAAIIAVLAALGTLFTHHRSILALAAKNQAILTQSRATDLYTSYESKQVRYNFYRVLLASDLLKNSGVRTRLKTAADMENVSAAAALKKARELEEGAALDDERSEKILKSYELLQFATTIFEVSIVLVSISALAGARLFLPLGCGLSSLGIVLLAIGLLRSS
jgi:small-conductance mechanosensitive channel